MRGRSQRGSGYFTSFTFSTSITHLRCFLLKQSYFQSTQGHSCHHLQLQLAPSAERERRGINIIRLPCAVYQDSSPIRALVSLFRKLIPAISPRVLFNQKLLMDSILSLRLRTWFPSSDFNASLEKTTNLFALPEDLVATRHRYYAWLSILLSILAVARIIRHSFLRAKPRIDVPVLNLENTTHEAAAKRWMYNYEELLHAGYKRVSATESLIQFLLLTFVHSSSMRCINCGRQMDS